MRLHITEAMIDASFEAMKAEALKDGHDWDEIGRASPEQILRFRQVVRAMIQAAADVATHKPTGE